jgi:SAM-dependent methyltransferase
VGLLQRCTAFLADLVLEHVFGHYTGASAIVRRHVDHAGLVLDVGGGTGGVSARLGGMAREVVVIEPSTAYCREGQRSHGHLRFVRGSADALPVADGRADLVLLVEVLHHVADGAAALREAARALAPGGRMVIEETDFTGSPGRRLRYWAERLSHGALYPRDRTWVAAQLAGLGLRSRLLEQEGFVVLAEGGDGDARAEPVGSVERGARLGDVSLDLRP